MQQPDRPTSPSRIGIDEGVLSEAVLVGHSYGGTVITAAGTDSRVAALVYIAALAPDADETTQSQLEKYPKTDVLNHVEVGDGRVWMRPDGVARFAGDLPEQEQRLVWATQSAPAADLFTQKVEGVAWRSKPNWYIVATKDHTVHRILERFLAKRMGATTTEVARSDVAMLSHPKTVLEVIRAAAHSVQTSASAWPESELKAPERARGKRRSRRAVDHATLAGSPAADFKHTRPAVSAGGR